MGNRVIDVTTMGLTVAELETMTGLPTDVIRQDLGVVCTTAGAGSGIPGVPRQDRSDGRAQAG